MADTTSFWNWGGRYVGYRLNDSLYCYDGRQVGYFAEGDEIYACTGDYLGEVRGGTRLITNLKKKAWTRRSAEAHPTKSSPGHPDIPAKELMAGYEDFPAPQARG